MKIKNQSAIMEFILTGLTSNPELHILLFWIFTFIYATALTSNILLIFTIFTSKKFHTPMYFLLVNLSLVNLFSISVIIPKLLQTLWTHNNAISFYGCITQVYLFIWSLATKLALLSFMAFDRYAAICQPLWYTVIMREEVLVGISTGAWASGMLGSAVHAFLLLKLSFCDSNTMDHFFCDLFPILKLACVDTSLNKIMSFVADIIFGICSCGMTLTSYCFILRSICKICSAEGKKKAFSTCSSHLIVVSFYFSAIIYTYGFRTLKDSLEKDTFVSVLYCVVTPIINPMIYSLRNKRVKDALKNLIGRGRIHCALQN